MASNRKECLDDAQKNLSDSHKMLHDGFIDSLNRAEHEHDEDARHRAIQDAKDRLFAGMQTAEQLYQGEVAACKEVYPT